jgi:hypothetical protein
VNGLCGSFGLAWGSELTSTLVLHLCVSLKEKLKSCCLLRSVTGVRAEICLVRESQGSLGLPQPLTIPGRQDSATKAQQMFSECRVKLSLPRKK